MSPRPKERSRFEVRRVAGDEVSSGGRGVTWQERAARRGAPDRTMRRFGHGVGSEPRAGARERSWRVRWGKDKVRDLKLWHMENGADLSE